jgi:hypothetical protein
MSLNNTIVAIRRNAKIYAVDSCKITEDMCDVGEEDSIGTYRIERKRWSGYLNSAARRTLLRENLVNTAECQEFLIIPTSQEQPVEYLCNIYTKV